MVGIFEISLMNFMIGQMVCYYDVFWWIFNILGGVKIFDVQVGYESVMIL